MLLYNLIRFLSCGPSVTLQYGCVKKKWNPLCGNMWLGKLINKALPSYYYIHCSAVQRRRYNLADMLGK